MIQTGIEFHLILSRRSLYPDTSQIVFPCLARDLPCLIKGKGSGLRLPIQPGILHGCIGKTHLGGYRLLVLGTECQIKSGSHTRRFSFIRTDIRPVESTISNGSLIQHRREIQRNRCPGLIFPHIFRLGNHPALDMPVFRKSNFSIPYSSALSLTVSYIEQDMAILPGRKCITLNSDTRGSGKLRTNRVIF